MWGQDDTKSVAQALLRIIPMRVGTSSFLHSFIRAIKDHPHACGDKLIEMQKRGYTVGIIPMRVGTSCDR